MITVVCMHFEQSSFAHRYIRIRRINNMHPLKCEITEFSYLTRIFRLKAEAEQVLENCRSALVAALRTWPGLIGCFSSTSSQGAAGTFLQSPVYALVASLCLDSEKIRVRCFVVLDRGMQEYNDFGLGICG